MQNRNVLNSSRLLELKKQRSKILRRKIFLFLFGFLVICVSLVYLSRINRLNISDVEITGNQTVDTVATKSIIDDQLAGKYLWLFPKTNIFIYPKNAIKNQLEDKLKRLKDINISIVNNKTLKISVSERKALYTWCGATSPIDDISLTSATMTDNKCYFIDEDGYIFDEAPYFSGEVYFKFYGLPEVSNSSDVDFNPLGSYVAKNNFKQLIYFKDTLLGLKLKPVSLYLNNNGDIDVYLSSGVANVLGPKIMVKADSDFQNVAENLEAAITTEPLQSEFKNKYSSLLYIDLRFGNKVYYKFSTAGAVIK